MLTLTHCVVDPERRLVHTPQGAVPLTAIEAGLLCYLAERRTVVSRGELLREVWGYNERVMSRTVDNTVARLRTKIEVDPTCPVHLLTEYGVGYRLVQHSESAPSPAAPDQPAPIVLSGIRVDLGTGQVFGSEGRRLLRGLELSLLRELVQMAGPVVDRLKLERRVWGNVLHGSSRLENLICRLRAKIERDPAEPVHLLTVRGHGYRFVLPDAAPLPGEATVLVADLSPQLGAAEPDALDVTAERLWEIVLGVATAHGGYASSLSGGRIRLVFSAPDDGQAASRELAEAVPGLRLGLATGEVRRFVDPLTRRFEYLGPAIEQAERQCHQTAAAPRGGERRWVRRGEPLAHVPAVPDPERLRRRIREAGR